MAELTDQQRIQLATAIGVAAGTAVNAIEVRADELEKASPGLGARYMAEVYDDLGARIESWAAKKRSERSE